jgi:hypothetical protein
MNIETDQQQEARQSRLLRLAFLLILGPCMAAGVASSALAGDREQAKRIHDRLVGTPPSADCLDQLQAKVATNNEIGAALDAITNDGVGDDCIGQDFYRVTLKNFITPWTNEEQTVFAPLNDYTATVIGIIRDNIDFREILSGPTYNGNILYTAPGAGLTTYSTSNNNHYTEMEDQAVDVQAELVRTTQTSASTLNLPAGAPAGIMSTRQGAKAFFVDGTNRAMFRFTLLNHLCTDLEQIKDTTRSPDRVRQDVSRSPGGDSRIFMNACVGCHSGMDPMAQAFAHYNYTYPLDGNGDPDYDNGQMVYDGASIQPKYTINNKNFEFGYVTLDDGWDNYWRTGPNSALGWGWAPGSSTTGSGSGAASMGKELADSYAFARCQVEKVFKAVCLRSPVDTNDRSQVDTMIANFSSGYNLKTVFAESAVYCRGD